MYSCKLNYFSFSKANHYVFTMYKNEFAVVCCCRFVFFYTLCSSIFVWLAVCRYTYESKPTFDLWKFKYFLIKQFNTLMEVEKTIWNAILLYIIIILCLKSPVAKIALATFVVISNTCRDIRKPITMNICIYFILRICVQCESSNL